MGNNQVKCGDYFHFISDECKSLWQINYAQPKIAETQKYCTKGSITIESDFLIDKILAKILVVMAKYKQAAKEIKP